ncbi:MAG: asparaginase [Phycisphaerales bacterium]|nr:asparaginase [Phycisphaerales bacterium]
MTDQNSAFKVALLSTGGTIEKTYDPLGGVLANDVSVLDVMLSQLALEGVSLRRVPVMNKDSLEMTSEDHDIICEAVLREAEQSDGVIVVHGTDRLTQTGELMAQKTRGASAIPIILTGAMRPWILRTTDAMQNLTEALMAVQLVDPGVYVCMHNRVLRFPGVEKDRDQLRFVPVSNEKLEVNS